MRPTLEPGDVVIASPTSRPRAGAIVVFPHPKHPGSWLVKRVAAISDGETWLESDNPTATMADSRTLGWIPTTDMYRAVWRFRRPFSWTRL